MNGLLKKMLGTLRSAQSRSRTAPRKARRPFLEILEERVTPAGGFSRELLLPVRPAAPAFTVTAVSPTQVNLSWPYVAGVTGYLIDEWVNDGVIVNSWMQIGSVNSRGSSYAVTGLSPGTSYSFKVAAVNAAGATWATARSALTFPAAPVFTATAVSATEVNFSWDAVAGASSYLIDESVNGAWQQIGSMNSPYTSYAATGLSPGTSYSFKVAAVNAAGATWAVPRSALTFPDVPLFWTTAVSTTQINLGVIAAAGATSYVIDVWANGAWKQLGSLTPVSGASELNSGLNFPAVNLVPGATYTFDVGAVNASGTTWGTSRSAATPSLVLINVDHPAAGQPYGPVSGTLFGPSRHPSYLDVQQGGAEDCSLMATLAEVAARDPVLIEDMVTYVGTALEGGDLVGVYTVRFFTPFGNGFGEFFVTVDTELPGTMYAQTPGGVLWPALIEKAFAQANGKGWVTTKSPGNDSYDALDNMQPSWAMRAIIGAPASEFSTNPGNLPDAWKTGKLIVLSTSSTSSPPSPYIVGNHAYAVVGYDPWSATPFKVYNPWGTDSSAWIMSYNQWGGPDSSGWMINGKMVYGLFNASAAFLSQNFVNQSVGMDPDAPAPAAARWPVTRVVVILDDPSARATPAGSGLAAAATGAHERDHSPGDDFWTELGTAESAARFLGPPGSSIPGGSEGTAVRAAGTHELDPFASDALWTDLGTLEWAAPFLGPAGLSRRPGR